MMLYGRIKSYAKSFLVLMFMLNAILANCQHKDTQEDTFCSSVSKWHPKMFYVVLPDLILSVIFPYEPDQSGFYNVLFISKESGETLLLDTIEDNRRYFTPFSSGSRYDVVLLYNNGKYVRYNDIIFENDVTVDMRNQFIQPSDSISEYWKTMRSFQDTDKAPDSDDTAMSDFVVKGYVLSDNREWQKGQYWGQNGPFIEIQSNETNVKKERCTVDGYFEIDVEDDSEKTLWVSPTLHLSVKINITAPCGLLLVIKVFGKARRLS